MSKKSLLELDDISSATDDDYLIIVNDPSGIPTTNKIRVNNLAASLTANTPTSNTSPGLKGKIAIDSNYIYVCVATNTWKRIQLNNWT